MQGQISKTKQKGRLRKLPQNSSEEKLLNIHSIKDVGPAPIMRTLEIEELLGADGARPEKLAQETCAEV